MFSIWRQNQRVGKKIKRVNGKMTETQPGTRQKRLGSFGSMLLEKKSRFGLETIALVELNLSSDTASRLFSFSLFRDSEFSRT